ncbi:MAG: VCBS repeat-containing protein [Myxococcota bacterium]
MKRFSWTTLLATCGLALGLGATGCNQSEFEDIRGDMAAEDDDGDPDDDDGDSSDGPGGGARDDENVGCEIEDDCGAGETCVEGVCQMQRCQDGPYASAPPMSANLRFFLDREFVVADSTASDGSFFIDGYAPQTGSIEYPGSWNMGSTAIIDVVGGDFFGSNPELFVVATAGSSRIRVGGIEEDIEIDIGFPPHALAAGDVDGDDKDEVFVLGQFGNYALCGMDDGQCSTGFFQNGSGVDAAIGDVDGDGQQEVVLLLDNKGTEVLFVLEITGEGDNFQGPAGAALSAIDVGDPDGDGVDEIFGIDPGGTFADAALLAYTAMGGAIGQLNSQPLDDASIDLSFGDLDLDEKDELLVLREGGTIELLRGSEGSMQLNAELTQILEESNTPTRIASVDFDGDSPRSHLMTAEPQLIPGQVVPLALGLFPPYEAEFSDGEASVSIGRFESTSESFSDSVSLDMGIDLGVSVGLFDIAKVGLGTSIRQSVSFTESQSFKKSIGTRFSARPDSYFEGEPYGVVVLTCGCFHAYYYEVEDPGSKLGEGGDGEQFVFMVPVGGTEMLWSTRRYNAMAEAVGNLPIMEIPYQVGNPSSYPPGPERLDGLPIPEEDFVFTELPSVLVSDAGSSGFRLSVGEDETNSVSMSTSLGFSTDVSGEIPFIGGVRFGASLGVGWGEGYSLSVGEGAFFGGSLPPLPDNPSTPDDEYLQFAYTTVPFVYREHYTDADGNDAAYYVVSFAVAQE